MNGIEPLRASCRWKAPMDDMTTIFTSWSLTNSCNHSLKQAKSTVQHNPYKAAILPVKENQHCGRHSASLAKICIAIMVGDASRLIQELRKKLAVATGAAWHHHLLSCKQVAGAKKPGAVKGGFKYLTLWQPTRQRNLHSHLGSKAMVSKSASSKRS